MRLDPEPDGNLQQTCYLRLLPVPPGYRHKAGNNTILNWYWKTVRFFRSELRPWQHPRKNYYSLLLTFLIFYVNLLWK